MKPYNHPKTELVNMIFTELFKLVKKLFKK